MPDSIFDLKQTLFTSNVPAPLPRDRGSEGGPNFDQALNSAQRQSRDDRRAHESQKPKPADKHPDTEQAEAAPHDSQDEVTLTAEGNESAATTASDKTTSAAESPITEETTAPTAEELAAAIVAPLDPAKPVLKQTPQEKPEQTELAQGIELNDAVQPHRTKSRAAGTSQQLPGSSTPATTTSNTVPELAATTVTTTEVEPHEIVAAAAANAAILTTGTKKIERTVNKPEQPKANHATKSTETIGQDLKPVTDATTENTLTVSVTPEIEPNAPAPKRRTETTRQTQPELNENELKLAAGSVLNTAAEASLATATRNESAAETPAKTPELPAVSVGSTNSAETPSTPTPQRGPQIPGSFANRLEAANAERKAADTHHSVDRTRFVQRVARAFQRAGETEGEIRLRLSPPELGAVKLEVSLRDGAMIARMETETTAARNLLMESLPQLKERLAEQNVRIETFEVEVRDQANHSSADDAREQLREQTEQQRNRLRGERATTPVVAQPIVRTLPAARQSSQLNVVI